LNHKSLKRVVFSLKLLRRQTINSPPDKPEENKFSREPAIPSIFAQFLQKTKRTTTAAPFILRKTFSLRTV